MHEPLQMRDSYTPDYASHKLSGLPFSVDAFRFPLLAIPRNTWTNVYRPFSHYAVICCTSVKARGYLSSQNKPKCALSFCNFVAHVERSYPSFGYLWSSVMPSPRRRLHDRRLNIQFLLKGLLFQGQCSSQGFCTNCTWSILLCS